MALWLGIKFFFFVFSLFGCAGLSRGMQDCHDHMGSFSCGMRTLCCGTWDLVP